MLLKKLIKVTVIGFIGSLIGCTTAITKTERLQKYNSGDSNIFIINRVVNKDLSKLSCKNDPDNKEFSDYMHNEICPNSSNLQFVSGFYYTHPFKGLKIFGAYAPKSMDIGVDDILKLSISIGLDGTLLRPPLVVKIAKKAGAKEPTDCYWEGGTYATTAFLSGGVVCEGWDWKKQKFSQ